MMLQGRPLRFLALVVAGWIGWRTFILWPVIEHAALLELPATIIDAHLIGEAKAADVGTPVPKPVVAHDRWRMATALPAAEPRSHRQDRLRFAYAGLAHFSGRFVADTVELGRLGDGSAAQIAPVPPIGMRRGSDRWQASAWLMTRGGFSPGTRQLGGSQAGIVVRHALTQSIGAYGRATSPLQGRGAELALGLDLRPGDTSVRVIAEHRFGIDGIAGGPAVGAVAGIGPQPAIAARPDLAIDVEAYGQAGVIWRSRAEPYGDGFVRVSQKVADTGGAKFDIGLGAWGAAQRDAQRVDVGPSVAVRVPVGDRQFRASIDWRERVAGDVRPGSGIALTLAADF